jgi:hypothetical protein
MHLKTALAQVFFKNILAVTRETGINIDSDQLVVNRRTTLQLMEDVHECIGILASGYSDGDSIALFNQIEFADSLTGQLLDFTEMGIVQ